MPDKVVSIALSLLSMIETHSRLTRAGEGRYEEQYAPASGPEGGSMQPSRSRKGRPRPFGEIMRKVCALLILCQCFFLFGFFFPKGNQNTEYDSAALHPQILLTVLGFQYTSENKSGVERVLNLYAEAHPDVLISYEGIPLSSYFQILNQRIKVGSADDVFMVSPERARGYLAEGHLLDLSGAVTLPSFRPDVLAQMRMDGAVPYMTNSLGAFGLFCNLKLLNRRRMDVPKTLEAFLAACETFHRAGITPLVGGRESLKALVVAQSFEQAVSGNAGPFFDALNADPEVLQKALSRGFALLALLRDKAYLDVRSLTRFRGGEADIAFAGGDQPFMLGGIWNSPPLEKLHLDFRFAVFPFPVEGGPVAVLGLDTPLAVSANSPRREQASLLVEKLTCPDLVRTFTDGQGLFSPLKDAPLPADKAVHPLWKSVNEGRGVFRSDVRLRGPVWESLDVGVEWILSGASAEEAAESVVRAVLDNRRTGSGSQP